MLNVSILPMHTSILGFQITLLMVQILINLRVLLVMSSSIGASTFMMRVLIEIWRQLRVCGGNKSPHEHSSRIRQKKLATTKIVTG